MFIRLLGLSEREKNTENSQKIPQFPIRRCNARILSRYLTDKQHAQNNSSDKSSSQPRKPNATLSFSLAPYKFEQQSTNLCVLHPVPVLQVVLLCCARVATISSEESSETDEL